MKSGISQFFLSTYFISNVLAILAYPALRLFTQAGKRDLKRQDSFGFTYQNSIIYTALVLVIIQYIRSSYSSGFVVQLFGVAKIGIAALLFFAKFKICLMYIGACIILWLVVPYPKYTAPNKFIKIKSVEQFDELIDKYKYHSQLKTNKKNKNISKNENEEDSSFQYQDKWMYFIQFYADWVLSATLSKQLWYSYSNKYTTQRLIFLQVNVDRFPQIAKRYKINTSAFSKQIPTLLVVSNGEQQMRFPPVDQNSKVAKVVKLDYKILLRYFDLQSRYLQTRQIKDGQNIDKEKKE